MNSNLKTKLALIAALAVVLAMVAATAAFNLFIGWKIESDAVSDIEYALCWSDESTGTGRVPGYLYLNESYNIYPDERRWAAPEEFELASWFAQHPAEGVVNRVEMNDWTCYAAIVSNESYLANHTRHELGRVEDAASIDNWVEPGYVVAYVGITAEQSLITTVNTAFALIAILGAAIAAAAGYASGRRIEQAQEAQKRFYENMSHDLKTPLAAIRGYAEGARNGVVDADDAMRGIEQSSSKMANMIDEILGLSRLESGAVQLNRETIDVDDFIQDCLMPFEGAVRSKGLHVDLDLASGTVEADRDLFDHALSNVLSNAVRHAASEVRITFDGKTIRVANDGDIPPADRLAHFFDRFYAGEGGSTGIGLAITHEVAAAHGWTTSAIVQDSHLVIAISLK